MIKLIAWAWTLLSLVASALFGLLFYNSYWLWRGCFHEQGRCWTGEVVHHDQTVYLALPLAFSLVAALLGLVTLNRLRSRLQAVPRNAA